MAWCRRDRDLIVPSSSMRTEHSFQNDECLALSVNSSNNDAADCYRIVSERTQFTLRRHDQIALGRKGTENLAIAVSQSDETIALLSRDGKAA